MPTTSFSNIFGEWLFDQVAQANDTSPVHEAVVQNSSREKKTVNEADYPLNPVLFAVDDAEGSFYGKFCTDTNENIAGSNNVQMILMCFWATGKLKKDLTAEEIFNAKEKVARAIKEAANLVLKDTSLGGKVIDAKPTKWREGWSSITTKATALSYLIIEINTSLRAR